LSSLPFEVVKIFNVEVVDCNSGYVLLSMMGELDVVESWVRRSKIRGGWQLKKHQLCGEISMKKATAINKGFYVAT